MRLRTLYGFIEVSNKGKHASVFVFLAKSSSCFNSGIPSFKHPAFAYTLLTHLIGCTVLCLALSLHSLYVVFCLILCLSHNTGSPQKIRAVFYYSLQPTQEQC